MRIFILRHEDRTQDCSFFSPLTKKGLENSEVLIKYLEQYNINLIFSSPFIRTLQTIYPYSKKNNIKINLEYGLVEIHHEDLIPIKSIGMYLPEYIAENFNYNSEYKTIIKPTDIKYKERQQDVDKRMKHIIKILLERYGNDKNKNILLVTHQSLCHTVAKIIKPNEKDKDYGKGYITEIFDTDNWVWKPINY